MAKKLFIAALSRQLPLRVNAAAFKHAVAGSRDRTQTNGACCRQALGDAFCWIGEGIWAAPES